ncbi:MAG: hypothetical protein IKH51_10240 [Clostridia bacterium]|nr:hypothetical protein [Clostridia bacterium]
MKKILCVILAAVTLICSAACTENGASETDTGVQQTELQTETETEEDQTQKITVPEYKDIGLTEFLAGDDRRMSFQYDFTKYTYSALRGDSKLVFTSNKDYVSDENGLTITDAGWNSVGFSYTLTEPYTAKASVINRSAVNNVRTIMFGVRVTRADHLYIDSGLWFTFSGSSVFAVVKNGFTTLVGEGFDFDAKNGLDLTITDDGTEIICCVGETRVASAVVSEENLVLYDKDGAEVAHTPDLARIAHGDTLGCVRTMSHFANSSTRSMSLQTGQIIPYSPDDTVTQLREGYGYLICDKTLFRTVAPVTVIDDATYTDAATAAALFGFDCTFSDNGESAVLTRDDASLSYKAGEATVYLNGADFDCPTPFLLDGTLLISADRLARWLGYDTVSDGSSVYIALSEEVLTAERKQEMNDRYQLYNDVVYNYDDVEIEKTGVGTYKQTPYEDRLVGIAYSTWLCPKVITWGKSSWDTPLYGAYYSDDRAMIAKHAELLRDAGVDFIFVDWTNNTTYDPATMRNQRSDFRMIEEATDLLFEIWSQIEGAPKICIFAGPGHSGPENVKNGKHQKKVDQIYSSYVEKYPDMYFNYEGKPLLMCYGATPNQYGRKPSWKDDRFTVRWVTGYVGQQSELYNKKTMATRGWWSWEERGLQVYSVLDDRVECVTCTAASRPQGSEGDDGYIPAYERENGLTLKKQFQRANDLGAGMVILVSWNEWTKGEQPSPEGSKDLEPSKIHGTFYYDLLCEQIKKFKGKIK